MLAVQDNLLIRIGTDLLRPDVDDPTEDEWTSGVTELLTAVAEDVRTITGARG